MTIRNVDYTALLQKPDRETVARFKAEASQRPEYRTGRSWVQGCAAIGFAVVFLAIALPVATGFSRFGFGESGSPVGLAFGGFGVLFGIVAIGTVAIVVRIAIRSLTGSWTRWTRLDAFARANGMVFSPTGANPSYPGSIFGIGSERTAVDRFTTPTDRFLDYGNYRYTTGSGKNRSTRTWGFLALQLDRTLPHMVLDAKGNDGLFGGTSLPTLFRRDQILSLEGDFDEHFTLYCPREYERDAYYVFTPDLMALLVDNAAPFDVEIVDRWLFVYSPKPFDPLAPALHQRLLHIVDTVGAKTLAQTDRYVDDRIGQFAPNIVAPQGQRLKRRVPVLAGVLVAVFALIWFLPQLLGAVGWFRG